MAENINDILTKLWDKEPIEIVAALKSKGIAITWNWQEALALIKQNMFTVAKVLDADVVQDIQDGLVKSLTGNIISTLSETKLKIVGAKIVNVSKGLAEKHYSDLRKRLIEKKGKEVGERIFENTIEYIQGKFHTDRILALVYQGENAIKKVRELVGETNPETAHPTSIRGKYGRIHSETQVFENAIHCSEDEKSAKRELTLWFDKKEIAK